MPDQNRPLFDISQFQPYLEQLDQAQQQASQPKQQGGEHPWIAGAIRMIAPILASEGGWPGAAIGGAGEGIAQWVNNEPVNKSAIAADAAISAVPLAKVFKALPEAKNVIVPGAERAIALAKNALRGASYAEASSLLRRDATTGHALPQNSDELKQDVIGALMGMLPAPFITKKGVPKASPEIAEAWKNPGATTTTGKTPAVVENAPTGEDRFVLDRPNPTAVQTHVTGVAPVREAPMGNTITYNDPETLQRASTTSATINGSAWSIPKTETSTAVPTEAPVEAFVPLTVDAKGQPRLDREWALSKKYNTKDAAKEAMDLAGIKDGVLVSKRAGWTIIPKEAVSSATVTEPTLEDSIRQNMATATPPASPSLAPGEIPILTAGQEPLGKPALEDLLTKNMAEKKANPDPIVQEVNALGDPSKTAFVRHGDTDLNGGNGKEELLRSQLDVPLNDTGRAAAVKAGQALAKVDATNPFTKIVTSDLGRAQETASLVKQALGRDLPITVDPNLRPWDLGDLAGQPVKKILPVMQKLIDSPDTSAPNGESFNQFLGRYLPAAKQIAEEPGARNIMIGHTRTAAALDALAKAGGDMDALDANLFKTKHTLEPGGVLFLGDDWQTRMGKTPESSVGKVLQEQGAKAPTVPPEAPTTAPEAPTAVSAAPALTSAPEAPTGAPAAISGGSGEAPSLQDLATQYKNEWDKYFALKEAVKVGKATDLQVRAQATVAGGVQAQFVKAVREAQAAGQEIPDTTLKLLRPSLRTAPLPAVPKNPNSEQLAAMPLEQQEAAIAKQVARSPKAPQKLSATATAIVSPEANSGAAVSGMNSDAEAQVAIAKMPKTKVSQKAAPEATTTTDATGQPYDVAVNLEGAKTGKDVQGRIATAIRSLIPQAPEGPQLEWHPNKAYGGREGSVWLNGNPVVDVDRYGSMRLSYGANAEDLGLQPVEPDKYGSKPRLGDLGRNLTPKEQGQSAIQFVQGLINKKTPQQFVNVRIPNGPTYSVPLDRTVLENAAQRIESDPSAFQDLVGPTKRPTYVKIETPYGTNFNAKTGNAPGFKLPIGNQKGFYDPSVMSRIAGALVGGLAGSAMNPTHPILGGLGGAAVGGIAAGALPGVAPLPKLPESTWDTIHDLQVADLVSGPATIGKIGLSNMVSLLQKGALKSISQRSTQPLKSVAKEAINLPQLAKDFVQTMKTGSLRTRLEMEQHPKNLLQRAASYGTRAIGAADTTFRNAALRAGLSPEDALEITQQQQPHTGFSNAALGLQKNVGWRNIAPIMKAPLNLLEQGFLDPVKGMYDVATGTSKDPATDIAKAALMLGAGVGGYGLKDKIDTLPPWARYLALSAAGLYNVPAALGYAASHTKDAGYMGALKELIKSIPLLEGIDPSTSTIASRIIPGMVRQLNPDYGLTSQLEGKPFGTTTKRDAKGLAEQIEAQIPGLAQELPEKAGSNISPEFAQRQAYLKELNAIYAKRLKQQQHLNQETGLVRGINSIIQQ